MSHEPGGITGAILSFVKFLIKPIVDATLELQIDLMNIINDAILRTTYPGKQDGTIYIFSGPEGDGLWASLYTVHESIAQPYGFLLIIFTLIIALLIKPISDELPTGSYDSNTALRRVVFGFFLITFWWEIGSIILAFADSFASLLVNNPAMESLMEEPRNSCESDTGESCQGLAITAHVVKQRVQESFAKGYIFQLLMVPIMFLYFAVLFVVAGLWKLRDIVIYFLMPMMPLIIGLWAFYVPGFTGIANKMGKLLNWFVIFAFLAIPSAFLANIGSYLAYQLIEQSEESESSSNQLFGYGFAQSEHEEAASMDTGLFTAYAILIVIPLLAALGPFVILAKSDTLKSTPYGKGLSKLKNTGERAANEARDTATTARAVAQGESYQDAIGVEDDEWSDMNRREKAKAGGVAGVVGAGIGKSPDAARQGRNAAGNARDKAVSATETAADLRYHGDEVIETRKENARRKIQRGKQSAKEKVEQTAETVDDTVSRDTVSNATSSATQAVKDKSGMSTVAETFEKSRQKDSFEVREEREADVKLQDDVTEAIHNDAIDDEMWDEHGDKINEYINQERYGTRDPDSVEHMGKKVAEATNRSEVAGLKTEVKKKVERLSKSQVLSEYGHIINPEDALLNLNKNHIIDEYEDSLSIDKQEASKLSKDEVLNRIDNEDITSNLSKQKVQNLVYPEQVLLDEVKQFQERLGVPDDERVDVEEDSLRDIAGDTVEGGEGSDIGTRSEMVEEIEKIDSLETGGETTRMSDKADRTEADNFESLFNSLQEDTNQLAQKTN